MAGSFPVLNRMRLECFLCDQNGLPTSPVQIMNEVTVHRGRNVQLAVIDCFVGNEHLTDAVVLLFN